MLVHSVGSPSSSESVACQSMEWRLQDSGTDARLPQWAEHLTVALPLGLLSGASLPARRGALRTLLEMLLAVDQAALRQVGPSCHKVLRPAAIS
jgi:hypothetical protein